MKKKSTQQYIGGNPSPSGNLERSIAKVCLCTHFLIVKAKVFFLSFFLSFCGIEPHRVHVARARAYIAHAHDGKHDNDQRRIYRKYEKPEKTKAAFFVKNFCEKQLAPTLMFYHTIEEKKILRIFFLLLQNNSILSNIFVCVCMNSTVFSRTE